MNKVSNLLWTQRVTRSINRILSAVMLACFSVVLVMALSHVVGNWVGWYLVPIVFVVALESMVSHGRLREVSIASAEWWIYRISELLVLFISLKVILYAIHGFGQLVLDLPRWRENFFIYFFDPEYSLLVLMIIAVWLAASELDQAFYQLEGDERLLMAEFDTGFSEQRAEVRQRLANAIIVGGGVMVALVAFMNIETGIIWSGVTEVSRGVIALVVYFLCGLVILSVTQYSILRVRWVINHVEVERRVTTRWFSYSLLMISLVALIAIILPTGYSGQLLQWLQVGFAYLLFIIQLLIYFLTLPFIWFFSWLMSLFKQQVKPLPTPPATIQKLPTLTLVAPAPWLELLKTILFWAVLIGLIGYAFYYYFHEHPEYFNWVRRSRFFYGLARWIREWLGWARSVNERMATIVRDGLQRLRVRNIQQVSRIQQSFRNPRRRSPREQIRFYYLALVRRGAESGLPRSDSQTPIEYSDKLIAYLNIVEGKLSRPVEDSQNISADISELTEGFLEARYSQHLITDDRAHLLHQYWERALKTLRILKK